MPENSMKKQGNDKLKVEIYVPLESCSCMFEHFINGVFQILTRYIKLIHFETKDINSEESRQLRLMEDSVVIESEMVFNSLIKLKNQLPKILKEKGLI